MHLRNKIAAPIAYSESICLFPKHWAGNLVLNFLVFQMGIKYNPL